MKQKPLFIDSLHWFLMYFGVTARDTGPEVMNMSYVDRRVSFGSFLTPLFFLIPSFILILFDKFDIHPNAILIFLLNFVLVLCLWSKVDGWEEKRYSKMYEDGLHLSYYARWSSIRPLSIFIIRFFVSFLPLLLILASFYSLLIFHP